MYKKLFVSLLGIFAMIVVVTQLTTLQINNNAQQALSTKGYTPAPVVTDSRPITTTPVTPTYTTGTKTTVTPVGGVTTELPGKAAVNKPATPTSGDSSNQDIAYSYQLSRTLSMFSPSSAKTDVMILQYFLKQEGYLAVTANVDGRFGYMTRAAVIKFQRANGISQTGNVGVKTKAAINIVLEQKGLVNVVRVGSIPGTVIVPEGKASVN